MQKVPVDTGQGQTQQKTPRGVRGKIVKNKKKSMEEYMQDAVALVKQYVPPDPRAFRP